MIELLETFINFVTVGNDALCKFVKLHIVVGNFVYHPGVNGQLKRAWSWPAQQVMSILALTGDKTIRISDDGAAKITVDSGLAVYNYILPAQSK